MKYIIHILLICLATSLNAQSVFEGGSDSDPKATAILDKIKAEFSSYSSITLDFLVSVELPRGDEKIVQSGIAIQQNDQYKLETEGQIIYCDGQDIWVYAREANEVQINDFEKDEDQISTPLDIVKIYESGNYVYALTNAGMEDGRSIAQVEFKPSNKVSDFSKIRVTVDTKKNQIIRLKTFEKDGSRMTFQVKSMKPNLTYDQSSFRFDPTCCPDVYIEDLRLD